MKVEVATWAPWRYTFLCLAKGLKDNELGDRMRHAMTHLP